MANTPWWMAAADPAVSVLNPTMRRNELGVLTRLSEQLQAQPTLNPDFNMEVLGLNLNELWAVDTWEAY